MIYHIHWDALFPGPQSVFSLTTPPLLGEEPYKPLVLSGSINRLLLRQFSGQLFLLVTKEREREYCGSGSQRIHHGWPRPESEAITFCVLGRFASHWEQEPVVERALLLQGFTHEEIPSENMTLTAFLKATSTLWGFSSRPKLLVGQEEVLPQLQAMWKALKVTRHHVIKAALALPLSRAELSQTPVILEMLQIERGEIGEALAQVEAEQRKATQVFEGACDAAMKKRRPLRDRQRLHQAWLAANPEPDPAVEPMTDPPAA